MRLLTGIFGNWLYPPKAIDNPELKALLVASQLHLSSLQQENLETLLSGEFNWDALIDLAVEHRVFPLVYWNLHTSMKALVPKQKLEVLQGHFGEAVTFNLQAKAELRRILQAFRERDINVMLIRGLALAYAIYGSIWLREFKDIDLLVEEADYERAEQLLNELHYVATRPIEDNAYNQKMSHDSLNVEVELHWALDSPFMPVKVPDNYFWTQSVPIELDGISTTSFPADELILTLCFHAAKHRWSRLKWLCDVNELLRKYTVYDWDNLLRKARNFQVERILLLNVWLSRDFFNTDLPAPLSEALHKDPVVELLGRYIRSWLFDQKEVTLLDQLRGIIFYLLIRENPNDRLPSISHALLYPKAPMVRSIFSFPPIRRLVVALFGSDTVSSR